jgi:hypothetical protein
MATTPEAKQSTVRVDVTLWRGPRCRCSKPRGCCSHPINPSNHVGDDQRDDRANSTLDSTIAQIASR